MATLDITAFTYDGVSLSFGATAANTTSVFFKPDGSAIYTSDYSDKRIYYHTLSTNWDLTTATLAVSSYSVSSQITYIQGLYFSSDGTKMYVADYNADKIYQYSLSSAWDITSATYDTKLLDLSAQSPNVVRFQFNSSGDILFVCGSTSEKKVFGYTLSSAWDISTAAYNNFLYASDIIGSCSDIIISSDGLQLFILNSGGISGVDAEIFQYDMTISWDLSTASYVNKLSVEVQDEYTVSFFFRYNDTKLYIYGDQDDLLYQYSTNISEPIDIALDLPSFEAIINSGASMAVSRTVPDASLLAKIFFLNPILPAITASITIAEPLHLAFTLPTFTAIATATEVTPAQMTVDLSKRSGRMYAAGQIITTLPERTMVSTAVHSRPATMEALLPVVTMDSYAAGQIRVKLKPFTLAITATNTHLASITISLPSYLSDIIATNKSLHPLAVTIPSYRMSGTISKANRATMTADWERFSFYADGYYGGVAGMVATIPIRKAVLNASFSTGNSFIISLPMFDCVMTADNYSDTILRHVRGALR